MTPDPGPAGLGATESSRPAPAEPRYAGFWIRAGAIIIDCLCLSPLIVLSMWSFNHHRELYYFSCIAHQLVWILFTVCLVKWRGGSPGKLVCRLRIVTTDFQAVGWKEAWLRESVMLVYGILSMCVYISAISRLSEAEFLGPEDRKWERMAELGGWAFKADQWFANLWSAGELAVILTNRRRRALHDYIAGTVVVHGR